MLAAIPVTADLPTRAKAGTFRRNSIYSPHPTLKNKQPRRIGQGRPLMFPENRMSIFSKLTQMFGSAEAPESEEDILLAHTVAMTDPRLDSLPNYGESLQPLIDHAHTYYEQSVHTLPGPVRLDEESPLLPLIFPNPDDMMAGLGRSLEIKQQLPDLLEEGHPRLWALLGLRTRVMPGTTQAVLTDHTFRSLAASPEGVRLALRDAAYDSLLQGFANETNYRQQKLELMQSQKELLQEAAATRKVRTSGVSQSIDSHIYRANKDLSPDRVLQNLIEWLGNPEPFLRLENRTGLTLKVGEEATGLIHLPLLSSQDRRQWLVCLVEFPAEMASEALARESHTHRFIMI